MDKVTALFMNHPVQPLFKDSHGALRFRENKIVSDLLAHSTERGFGLNEIARKGYSKEDQQQLAQLIGYSLSGYSELRSYVDDAAYAVAVEKSKRTKKSDVEIERDYYRNELMALKKALQNPMARLFEIHPDDLHI